MTKAIYKSKTVIFNVITFLLAVIALPEFSSIIPVDYLPVIALVNSIGNIILRVYFTAQPITTIEDAPSDEI